MSATGPSGPLHVREQPSVLDSGAQVIRFHRQRGEQLVNARPASLTSFGVSEFDPGEKLRCSDRSDSHVVVVMQHPIHMELASFRPNQDRRVEQQPAAQPRSSMYSRLRMASMSSAQSVSGS